MDDVTRSFFELQFKVAFMEKKADEFQDFFSTVMEKCHPSDFIRVRPWGRAGDRKNDGYLRSERTLYQVYAPNELSANACTTKMEEDFAGALPHWSDYFDKWVFVHNSRDGLGPDVTKKLLELDKRQAGVSAEPFGFEELRKKAFGLSANDLASLLGPAPTRTSFLDLGVDDLAPILDQLALVPPSADPDLRPPPADKIAKNMLSTHVADLLKVGMTRADLVRDYFRLEPGKLDSLAESFRQEYAQIRGSGVSPDEIFAQLQRFAGGGHVPTPARQSGVLAVLAFFFEECDIFERTEDNS